MKCRDMNPGNVSERRTRVPREAPSMKCRDMNPGNLFSVFHVGPVVHALNEVPGYESRQ